MILQRLLSDFNASLYHTVYSHGWFRLAPWHWNHANNTLSRSERLRDEKTYVIKIRQNGVMEFTLEISQDTLDQVDLENIRHTVKRWLSLDWDPRPAIRTASSLDTRISSFIKDGGGRFLRSSTFYEDFVKTVCTINTNWSSTLRMSSALVDQIGKGTFPSPLEIIMIGQDTLSSRLKLGFRSKVLIDATNHLLTRGIMNENGQLIADKLTFEDLLQIRGIGPYSASHIMMLCHDYSRIPIDSTVISYCKDRYGLVPDEIQEFFHEWGDHRMLGYKISRLLDDNG